MGKTHWFTIPKRNPGWGSGILVGKHPACLTPEKQVFAAATRRDFGEAILQGKACISCARHFLKLSPEVSQQVIQDD